MSESKLKFFDNVNKFVELGLNISYYRKRKGIIQEKLAEMIGVSRSHLSAIEAPNIIKAFSIQLLFDIANALEIEPYKLLMFRD